MLGIRTWGRSMVGADETMELWQPPIRHLLLREKRLREGWFSIMRKVLTLEEDNERRHNTKQFLNFFSKTIK